MSTLLSWFLIAVFAAGLVYAAHSDLRRLEIPNWLNLGLAALFAPAAYMAGFSLEDTAVHYAIGLGFLLTGMVLFALRILGGGDVKMMAAAATWLGGAKVLPFVVYVALAGGLLALLILTLKRTRTDGIVYRWLPWLADGGDGAGQPIPYGVAIAVAALWLLPGLAVVPAR